MEAHHQQQQDRGRVGATHQQGRGSAIVQHIYVLYAVRSAQRTGALARRTYHARTARAMSRTARGAYSAAAERMRARALQRLRVRAQRTMHRARCTIKHIYVFVVYLLLP